MGRLIIVPQYPTVCRYQEWWFRELPHTFANYFSEVIVLGVDAAGPVLDSYRPNEESVDSGLFANDELAIQMEALQMIEYMGMVLRDNDVMLVCDISYPGFFSNVLFHKRPKRVVGICHATSINTHDLFSKQSAKKFMIESATAAMYDTIIVASKYHRRKLIKGSLASWMPGHWWNNTVVQALPDPPLPFQDKPMSERKFLIVSASRPGTQKVDLVVESLVEKSLDVKIKRCTASNYFDYYNILRDSNVLLITSKEETYGYQIIDAIRNNCIVLAPNKFSYPEMLNKMYLYNTTEELIVMLRSIKDNMRMWLVPRKLIDPDDSGTDPDLFYDTVVECLKGEGLKKKIGTL